MKLTPLDVRKQEFRKTLRGFDPVEVQTFLDMVAEEYEQVLEDNKQLNRRLVELETKLQDFQETEKNLRETLLNVQEVKKQSEESSRRQADLVIKESELKALEIIESARKHARKMRDEVNILKTQKESFINRLRQILISQIELLGVLEIDDAIPEEAQQYVESVRSHKKTALKKDVDKSRSDTERKATRDEQEEARVELDENDEEDGDRDESGHEEDNVRIPSDMSSGKETEADKERTDEQGESSERKKPGPRMDDNEINEFFKKGIPIDELIKNLNKKQQK